MEPHVPRARHGPLRRRPRARSLRHAEAVVNWVEKGNRAGFRHRHRSGIPGRSRPLCAYPKHAQYIGTGDTQDARNFQCQNPAR